MRSEQLDQAGRDLETIQRASGLPLRPSRPAVRGIARSLVFSGILLAVVGIWRPAWFPWCVLGAILLFLAVGVYLGRSELPSFPVHELRRILLWVICLFFVCLGFAIWGVLVEMPSRVLYGTEMFIGGIFPLPSAITARDSLTWVCGIPLMAAGLALPFVPLPVGVMAGLAILLSGICYGWICRCSPPAGKETHAD